MAQARSAFCWTRSSGDPERPHVLARDALHVLLRVERAHPDLVVARRQTGQLELPLGRAARIQPDTAAATARAGEVAARIQELTLAALRSDALGDGNLHALHDAAAAAVGSRPEDAVRPP